MFVLYPILEGVSPALEVLVSNMQVEFPKTMRSGK